MTEDTTAQSVSRSTAAERSEQSLLVRSLWFVFVGWWLTGLWTAIAWFCFATIVGAPIGVKLVNYVPLVVSLKEPTHSGVAGARPEQPDLLVRAIWFVFVGWWLGALLEAIAGLAIATIVGAPVGVWMLGKLPYAVSLYRY